MDRFIAKTGASFEEACGIMNVAYWDYDVAIKMFNDKRKREAEKMNRGVPKEVAALLEKENKTPEEATTIAKAMMQLLQRGMPPELEGPKPVPQTDKDKDAMVADLVKAVPPPMDAATARGYLEAAGWKYHDAEDNLTVERIAADILADK